MRPEAKAMTEIIVKSVDELKVLFAHLGNMKKDRKVMEQVIEVNRLENEGDLVYRDAMSRLFREEKDPVEIYVSEDMIILKKHCPADTFTGVTDDLVEFHGKMVSKESIKELAKLAGIIE